VGRALRDHASDHDREIASRASRPINAQKLRVSEGALRPGPGRASHAST